MASERFTVDWGDTKKVLEGAGVAVAGSLATYISEQLIPQLYNSHDGVKLLVAALLMIGVNAARKWLSDTRPTVQQVEQLRQIAR